MKTLIFLILSTLNIVSFANNIQTNFKQELITNNDPLEGLNRMVFNFNKVLDDNILSPIARSYKENVPEIAQTGVSNFFSNLGEVKTFTNQVLQLKLTDSFNTLFRFIINSTIGLGGVVDVMSAEGVERKTEDFGQTLGFYGVPSGPYLVIPILGPSSLRDVTQLATDEQIQVNLDLNSEQKITKDLTKAISKRAEGLPLTDVLYNSEDPYTKVRSSYLQNREYQIKDGKITTDDIDF
jgi:phospholipid-binding lipoprotein MlaA